MLTSFDKLFFMLGNIGATLKLPLLVVMTMGLAIKT
jgi:hypothetical protein